MKKKILLSFAVSILFFFISTALIAESDFTIEPVSNFGGTVMALTVQDNYTFILQCNNIVIYDMSEPTNPVLKKTFPITFKDGYHTYPWSGERAFLVKGNYLYIVFPLQKNVENNSTQNINQLIIVDISNITSPIIKGYVNFPLLSNDKFNLALQNNYLFLTNYSGYYATNLSNGKLYIIDVSNPEAPTIKQNLSIKAADIFIKDNYIYLPVEQGSSKQYLKIYDYNKFLTVNSDNVTEAEIASYDTDKTSYFKTIYVSNERIYLGNTKSNIGTVILSVDNDSMGISDFASIPNMLPQRIIVKNNIAYIATENNFLIYDVSSNSPIKKSAIEGKLKWFDMSGNYAYLLPKQWAYTYSETSKYAFQTIDVSNPEAPKLKSDSVSPKRLNSIVSNNNKLYISNTYGLMIYSLASPGYPAFEKYYTIDEAKEVNKIAVDDNFIYVSFVSIDNKTDELRILSRTNPELVVAHYYTENFKIFNFAVEDGKCYLIMKKLYDNEAFVNMPILRAINLSNISEITQIGADIPLLHMGKSIFAKNKKVFIGGFDKIENVFDKTQNNTIMVYDFSNPNNIVEKNIHMEVTPNALYVSDENIYVGGMKTICDDNGENCEPLYSIYIYNINDLSSPIALIDNESGQLWDMQVIDDLIFLAVNGQSTVVYQYDKSSKKIGKKGVCHSPGSVKLTVTKDSGSGEGYVYSLEEKISKEDSKYYIHDYTFSDYSDKSGSMLYYYPLIEGNEGVYVQKFKTPPSGPIPILTLGGNVISKDVYLYTETKKGDNVTIAAITLTANEIADWQVGAVNLHGYGCGDEAKNIKKARLYFGSVGGQLLGESTYSSDNGTVSFPVNKKINKGSSITLMLEYELKEDTCPCRNFKIHIDMSDVSATPLEYEPGKKLPIPPQGVDSGPITVKPGELLQVSGNDQWGEKMQPLKETFKVKVEKEFLDCVDYVQFEVYKGSQYKAKLQSTNSLKSQIKLNANGEAEETLILGDKAGKKYPYQVSAYIVQKDKCQCNYSNVMLLFTAWGEGLEVTAQHDGNKNDDKFSTFISNIEAENKFTATLHINPKSDVKIKEVDFTFAGETKKGNVVKPNEIYEATFDMKNANQSSNLNVEAIEENGNVFDEVNETVKAINYPSWVANISKISDSITHEFDDKDEKYIIKFEYPTNFKWKDAIPGDIGLLGGLDFNLPFEFHVSTEYFINETSNIEAGANGEIELLGQGIEWEGSLTGNFNKYFEFQEGTGTISAKTSFDLPEKGFSKTFVVYGVPITVAVDIGGNVEIFVDGEIVLNDKLEFKSAKVTPGTTVTGEITVSLSAVFGLAKLAATGEPGVTVKIEVSYVNGEGTTTKWGGEVVVPIKVVGSIFWGMGSAELYSTELGPWKFGNIASGASYYSSVYTANTANVPDLISVSSIARDSKGNIMQVWIGDTDNATGSVNPDVYFRYFNGNAWTPPAPIIGSNSPNEFWEMDPYVIALSNGKFLAAWTSNNGDKNLDNLNDIFAHQDIMYSLWNGASWSEPNYIINDNEGDGSVFLSYDSKNNKVFAVWVHDKNSDSDINTRTEWKLMYSIYNISEDKWESPKTVDYTDEGSADFMPALSSDNNGNTLLVWVKDIDGKFFKELDNITNGTNVDHNNADSNVVFSKFENGSWTQPETITEPDNMSDAEPFIKLSDNGNAIATWVSRDGVIDKLYYSLWNGSEWLKPVKITESHKFIENPRIVAGDNISVSWTKNNMKSKIDYAGQGLKDGINYMVIQGIKNKPAIVYRGYNGYDGEIYYTVYNNDNMSWSTPDNVTNDTLVDWNISAVGDNEKFSIEYKKPEQIITVEKGWQLLSIPVNEEFKTGEKFNKSTTVWGWSGSSWEVWSGDENIKKLLTKYKITILAKFEIGKGYWLNSASSYSESFQGTNYGKEKIVLSSGWNLVGCGIKLEANEFGEAKTLWQWTGNSWKVWSPQNAIMNLLNQYKIEIADEIKAGEGFWVNK
jgi:hypothetical protein